jgi:predicted transcriptional regulator
MTGKKQKPTDSEVEILSVLWENGPATVREVHSKLIKLRDVGYTTTLKMMQIMFEKGLLVRDESQRSHIYRPRQKAETLQKNIVKDVISRVFSGATDKLVMQALSAKPTTPEQIAKIRQMLDQLEEEGKQ